MTSRKPGASTGVPYPPQQPARAEAPRSRRPLGKSKPRGPRLVILDAAICVCRRGARWGAIMEAAAGSPACAGVGADTSASGFEVPSTAAASSYGAGGYDTLVLMPESRAVAGYETLATAGTGSPEPEGGEAAGALLSTLYSADLEAAGPSGQAPQSPCGAPGWVASATPHPRTMGCAHRWGRCPGPAGLGARVPSLRDHHMRLACAWEGCFCEVGQGGRAWGRGWIAPC